MDDRRDDESDEGFWVIPLHGIGVPLPPTADAPQPPPAGQPVSDGFAGEPTLLPLPDELPTDQGFHPRLRRSA